MTPEELAKRLRLGEDALTELKSLVRSGFAADSKDLAKAIAALANTKGGLLLLGVENDGTVTGAGDREQLDKLMLQVSQVCQASLQPAIFCALQKLEHEGQTLLAVEVPSFSPDRPYQVQGKCYVRDANQSREAKREELIRLLQSANYHFDEQPVDGATFQDLERSAIRAFLELVYEQPDLDDHGVRLLQALKCLTPTEVPTVTGILGFGREPQKWLPDARISALLLPGTEPSLDFSDRQELDGRLPDQVEAAIGFVKRNLRSPSHVEGTTRVEEGIPERVLREAILNAVAHRDYRAASQVRIFVFDDRVEIVNPGELLNQLTIDGIRLGGISQRRNPALAALLARAGRRENVGMGVPEMVRLMKARKLPPPELTVESGHFKVVLRLSGAADA